MTRPILELEGVQVDRGGACVLDVARFRLAEGERIALVGPNGSGKSTLLLALMGLLPRRAGRVLFRGRAAASDAEVVAIRRRMGMVLQEPTLFDATVFENVATGLRLRGVRRAEVGDRVRTVLGRFRLAHLAERAARELSGGEARRVSLARALVVDPEVVLLDEPFTALDLPTREAITHDLDRALRERGVASVLVTHDPADARRLSDRVVAMERGRIVGGAALPAVAPAIDVVPAGGGLDAVTADAAPA